MQATLAIRQALSTLRRINLNPKVQLNIIEILIIFIVAAIIATVLGFAFGWGS